jgi:hypothetical protein
MKKLSRDAFSSLRESFPVLTIEEMLSAIGGSTCVIHCYAYISNIPYDWWINAAAAHGYDFNSSGGISYGSLEAVGSIGSLYVGEITNSSSLSNYLASGTNNRLMVTFNHPSGPDHAAVVTYINSDASVIEYYDPSNGKTGTILNNQITGLYEVGFN